MECCKKTVLFIYYGVLMFMSFQVSDVSSATDTISTNQSPSGDQTIVSRNDMFEFGLFNPDPHKEKVYLGMWYNRVSPRITVWISNRGNFTSVSDYYFVKISNGNLILYSNSTDETLWSTGVKSSRSKDVRAVLLDNGNLVLRDGPTSSAAVLWQSFDHPTDTWLPGAKLKLRNPLLTSWKTSIYPSLGRYTLEVDPVTKNSLISVWNGSKSFWSSRPFDDVEGVGGLRIKLSLDGSYITYSYNLAFATTSPYRLFMSVSGRLQIEVSFTSFRPWILFWSQPINVCEVYNYCGSFGICNETRYPQPCRCVPGFIQPLPQEFDSSDFSSGCERETKLQCDKRNNSFQPIESMKLATDPTTLVLTRNLVTTCARLA